MPAEDVPVLRVFARTSVLRAIRKSTVLLWQIGKELGLGMGGINCLVPAEARSLL